MLYLSALYINLPTLINLLDVAYYVSCEVFNVAQRETTNIYLGKFISN